jgi:MFS family permease
MSLSALFFSRLFTSLVFMTYPACLPTLMTAWDMSGAEAGLVQTSFTVGFAVSLLLTSWAADRAGAKRVFLLSAWLAAVAALCFAAFARSFESALLLVVLVGVSQGGAYTPAIMLVSESLPPERRGTGVGWILAGMSAGYVGSIAIGAGATATLGYEIAFLLSAAGTLFGAVFAMVATRGAANRPATAARGTQKRRYSMLRDRRSLLLTVGYMGHCFELFGVWSWVPAFLTISLEGRFAPSGAGAIGLGVAIALALHLSGFVASFSMGRASDRFGRRIVLIVLAALGALCSFGFGWSGSLPPVLLLSFATLYGFVTIGDSSVLSTAMTDSVPAGHLGRALGIRSILGIGLGAAAPAAFGTVLDLSPSSNGWGWAFVILGVGGLVATVCAFLLPAQGEEPERR